MIHKVLADTALGVGLFLSTTIPSSQAATPNPGIPHLRQVQDYDYVVKTGDSLESIAKQTYGSESYWTTIWNDNPDLSSPDVLEPDTKLTMRFTPPMLPEYLDQPLQDKLDEENAEVQQELQYSLPKTVNTTPQTISESPKSLSDEQMDFLGHCESGMTASRNSGNGFYGAFQFSSGTWRAMGTGYDRADLAPLEVQKDAVQRLLSRSSIYTQFPGCSRKMQLAGLL